MKKEVLLPVGNIDAFKAALCVPADAIYLGYKLFSARKRAKNFSFYELLDVIYTAKKKNIRVYLTLNTILFPNEIKKVAIFLELLRDCPPDAIIIQDLGLYYLLKKLFPFYNLHSSTQMNNYRLESFKFLESLGFERAICARETTKKEMKFIKENTSLEVEGFVHGAHCLSFSGICHFSFHRGKRSGNRGDCAQPCRLSYKYNQKSYPYFSPKDLCLIDFIDDYPLDFLKIEGRLKKENYVYWVGKAYSKNNDIDKIKAVFHREFSTGNYIMRNPKDFLQADKILPGMLAGILIKKEKKHIIVKLHKKIIPGCGIITEKLSGIVTKLERVKNNVFKIYGRFSNSGIKEKNIYVTSFPIPKEKIEIQSFKINIPIKIFISPLKNIEFEMGNHRFTSRIIPDKSTSGKDFSDIIRDKIKTLKKDRIILNPEIINSAPFFINFKDINTLKHEIKNAFYSIKKENIYKIRKQLSSFFIKNINNHKKKALKIARIYDLGDLSGININKYNILYVHEHIVEKVLEKFENIKIIPYFFPVGYDDRKKRMLKLKTLGIKEVLVGDTASIYLAKKLGFEIHIDYFLPVTNPLTLRFFEEFKGIKNIILSPEIPIDMLKHMQSKDIKLTYIKRMQKPILFFTSTCLFNQHGFSGNKAVLKHKNGDIEVIKHKCMNIVLNKKSREYSSDTKKEFDYILHDFSFLR